MAYVNKFTRIDRRFLDPSTVRRVNLYGGGCADIDLYGIYRWIGIEIKCWPWDFFYACRRVPRANKKVFRDDLPIGVEADRYRGLMILIDRGSSNEN